MRFFEKNNKTLKKYFLKYNSRKKPSFTLSEVLIVLGIIGIVATLTIPNLQSNSNKKELVSAYLKVHNTLSEAYKESEAVNGFKLYGVNPELFKKLFEEHLKIFSPESCGHNVCLMDGAYFDYECDEDKCNYLTVDTNGNRKPNQMGKDIYKFKITNGGLISEGYREACTGYDCGNYVIANHKIFEGSFIQNCIEHDGNECLKCKNNYLLTDKECKPLSELNCKNSKDGRNCFTCNDKFKNNSGVCEEISIDNCDTYSQDKCSVCKGGFYVNSQDKCTALPTGCADVDKNSNVCTTCLIDYKMTGTNCVEKPLVQKNQDRLAVCIEEENSTCTLSNNLTMHKIGNMYVTNAIAYGNYVSIQNVCSSRGLRLPNQSEAGTICAHDFYGDATQIWTSSSNQPGTNHVTVTGSTGCGASNTSDTKRSNHVMCVYSIPQN